ncbi:MAG: dolichyl-diphosphooligosaccharide--protein glycosyltransferase subunit STT3 [Candidatus Omnitrophica bacterium]|nr:dolichyl-diphosphooligosaccharide--protein glycosyltransferase subunit STT3 [Candidatus Omnitrophota bacterium]
MKNKTVFFVWLGLVLFVNIYFRLFPAYLPRLKEEAADRVEAQIYQQATAEIDKRFAHFSPLAKDELLRIYIADFKKKNARTIKEDIDNEYKKLKAQYQDESGQTFIMELDCWNWARYVENILLHGYPGDLKRDGQQMDMLMWAPIGQSMSWNHFLYYISAYLYKIFVIFKNIPLFTFLFYLPLLFLAIFIVILFLFCYRWGLIASITTSIFVGLSPIFINRSCAGWFDTDVLNLILPLSIVWTYLKVVEAGDSKEKVLWLIFSSSLVGLFCFTWQQWWFIFLVIVIYEMYSILNARLIAIKTDNSAMLDSLQQHVANLVLFSLLSLCWVIIFCGPEPIWLVFSQIKSAFFLTKPITASPWPNVYSTVAELRQPEFRHLSYQVGGVILYLLSFISVIILYLRQAFTRHYKGFSAEAINILIFWFIATFFASLHAVRLTMFMILPMGICLGWLLSDIYSYIVTWKKRLLECLFTIAISAMLVVILKNGFHTAYNIFPLLDEGWYKTLIYIRKNTSAQAILNSWWDFGDWFKTIARRRTIFDGQSQNTPQAYWMANVLLADNERQALAILRMLNNGGNRAFEIIEADLKDSFRAMVLLKRILALNKEEAKTLLSAYLPFQDAEEVIRIIFERPAPAYFIVDPNMQHTIQPISFLGNWDFLKVYVANNLYKINKEKIIAGLVNLDLRPEDAERLYLEAAVLPSSELDDWVTNPLRLYGDLSGGEKKNGVVLFDNKFVYNINDNTGYFFSERDGRYKVPKSLFILDKGALKEITPLKSDSSACALVFKEGGEYKSLLLPPELAKSLFVRLYYLNGEGLSHFKPFLDIRNNAGHIRVFEIIWD